MGAIDGPGKNPTAASPAANTNAASLSSTASPSTNTLRVGTEYVDPNALWRFERDNLIEAARNMDAATFRRHLEQESARLVREGVTERLLYQKATERITPQVEQSVDAYIDSEIRKIVTESFGGVQRRYERDLQNKGVTLDQVREKMRREIIIAGYLDAQIKPKIVEPSRSDLLMAYEAYRQENEKPERRRMSLIDVRMMDRLPDDVVDPTAAQREDARRAARSRIDGAAQELATGASFAEVAKKYSDGLHAFEGGAWGWVSPGSVRKRFEPAVKRLFTLSEGAVSEVIEYDGGYFLVRCDEIDGGGTPDFVALQPELKDRFSRNMFNELVSELVEELRDQARVNTEDLDTLWQATLREGIRIVQESLDGPPHQP